MTFRRMTEPSTAIWGTAYEYRLAGGDAARIATLAGRRARIELGPPVDAGRRPRPGHVVARLPVVERHVGPDHERPRDGMAHGHQHERTDGDRDVPRRYQRWIGGVNPDTR